MEIASLGVRVDSDGTLTASQRLDKLTASATKAENVTGSLARQAMATDQAATGVAGSAQRAANAMGLWVDQAGRVRNVTGQFASAAEKAQAASMGLAGALDEQAASAVKAAGATGMAGKAVNDNVARMGGSMSGLAAQFQDIGVTAAMGMNPVMIALQQGTQIAGQMEMAMQSGGSAVGVFAQAFKSLLSPVSIASIALTALAAAGLQMVDWGGLAAGTLNVLADGLEMIAPYAVAAAGGMALIYAPAIIGGLGTLIGSLGGVAKGVLGIATAIYATVGLPALLIAGFAAMVAGAVIWRDDLTKMLGVDIVGAAQTGINSIVGAFVGAFNGIIAVWNKLPGALGDLVILGVNATISAVEGMLNNIIGRINNFMNDVRMKALEMGFPLKDGVGTALSPVSIERVQNPWPNEAAGVGDALATAMSEAMAVDYVGTGIKGIQDFASGAADALRDLADGIGVSGKASAEAAKEAKRQAEAYSDLTRGAREFIANQTLEQQALGMTAEAAARMRYEQDLLNKAANDNIKLSGGQKNELMGLAAQMAATEEATRRMVDTYNFGSGLTTGFFSDVTNHLREQASEWRNIGDVARSVWEGIGLAGANALQKIADKALENMAMGIWDMISGAFMGGFGGNSLGGGWGVAGGFGRPGIFGIPGMADGGTVGRAGLSWVGERGPELLRLPQGAQVIPNGPSLAMAANANNSNDSRPITLRLVMPDGWRAEILEEAGSNAVRIVQANDQAQRNYRQNGG